jgi:hypothetical protein
MHFKQRFVITETTRKIEIAEVFFMILRASNVKIGQQGAERSRLWRIQGVVAVGLLTLVFSACEADRRAVVAPVSPLPLHWRILSASKSPKLGNLGG